MAQRPQRAHGGGRRSRPRGAAGDRGLAPSGSSPHTCWDVSKSGQDPRDPGGAGTLSWNLTPLPSSNPSVSVPYSLHTGTQTAVLQWDRGL